MIFAHFQELRRVHPTAHIRVYVEANMSWISASQLEVMILRANVPKLEFVRKDTARFDRVGVWTGEDSKQMYALRLLEALRFRNMRCAPTLISNQPKENLKLLVEQLKQFRRVVTQSKVSPHALPKVTLTGKSPGKKDDFVLALGIVVHYMTESKNDLHFMRWCDAMGYALS